VIFFLVAFFSFVQQVVLREKQLLSILGNVAFEVFALPTTARAWRVVAAFEKRPARAGA